MQSLKNTIGLVRNCLADRIWPLSLILYINITPLRAIRWLTSRKNWSAGANYLVGQPMMFVFPLYCGYLVGDQWNKNDEFCRLERFVMADKYNS